MGDDGDRAGGVVQDGLADRAEQQSGEPAAAAGTDDNQSRPDLMPGAVEELVRWTPLLAVSDVLPRYALADGRS
jgi:hypothetical protein